MTTEAPARVCPGQRTRLIRTVALVVGVLVTSLVLRELVEARIGHGPVADLSAVAVPMAATAWLAPYASYRRRDALLWLVGPGIYVFTVIAWRVALAPYRDWRPRPEEQPRMRWPAEPAGDVGHTSSR